MTLPIHQSDVELLLRVVTGTSMVALAEEAACTPPNIARKVKRIKERLSWTPCMTVEQIRQRAGAVRLAGRSTGPEVLKLIVERDQLKAENAGLRTGYEAYERMNAELKAEVEKLRGVMACVVNEIPRHTNRNGNAPGHCHSVPGIWDRDNGAKAGTECGWCKVWNAALAMSREPARD